MQLAHQRVAQRVSTKAFTSARPSACRPSVQHLPVRQLSVAVRAASEDTDDVPPPPAPTPSPAPAAPAASEAAAPVAAEAAAPPHAAAVSGTPAPTAAVSVETASSEEVIGGPENVRLRIRMRGYDIELLKDAVEQIQQVCKLTGAEFIGPIMLPTKRRLYCVLTSPHVDKDAREHFEIRVHNRLVDLRNLSSQAITAMMEWEPPSGLDVECSVV